LAETIKMQIFQTLASQLETVSLFLINHNVCVIRKILYLIFMHISKIEFMLHVKTETVKFLATNLWEVIHYPTFY